jgi:hypothetical protein
VKRYGQYGRKASWRVIRYGQYRRKASWKVKWYVKYGSRSIRIVIRYGVMEAKQVEYWKDMKIMEETQFE